MTSSSLGLLHLPPNMAHPVSSVYRGIVYPGEVVWADQWDPGWGAALKGDRFFRLVFLKSFSSVDTQALQDTRIVVCSPPRAPGRKQQERELLQQVLRETRARYPGPDTEAAFVESQRQTYASGIVVHRTGLPLSPADVFQQPSPQSWFSQLAEAVLGWTYPRLPIGGFSVARPLGVEEARLLFRGLIAEERGPEVTEALGAFAPRLGLAAPTDPATFDPRGCPFFDIMGREMAQGGGSWECEDLYHRLAHVHALPHHLITLYLLAFVFWSQPAAELHLRPEHRLSLADGAPYPGRVLLAETVKGLRFPAALEQEAELLRYLTPVSWNTVSLYFWPLDPELAPQERAQTQAQAQADRLMAVLRALSAEVRPLRGAFQNLSQALGQPVPEELDGMLGQFRRLAQSASPEAALQVARHLFGSPDGLARAIARYRTLRQLAEVSRTVADTFRYLQGAVVPREMAALHFQRQALAALLDLRELTASSFSASPFMAQRERFIQEYQAAYRRHHEAYAQEVASLHARLQDAQPEAAALDRLNGLAELGDPPEAGAPEKVRRLLATLPPCPAGPRELPLQDQPVCPACHLRLTEEVPRSVVEDALGRLDRGLREQNRRLSLLVVHRILGGQGDEQVQRFLQIVQASDLTGLAAVLDDHLLDFLRELLARA